VGVQARSSPDQPLNSEESDVGDGDSQLVEIRAAIAPAVRAFNTKNMAELRAWIARPSTRPAYKVYGSYLLLQLGAEDAKQLFVEHFPARSAEEFGLFWELEIALSESGAPYVGAQKELICGAVADWPGAAAKLIEIHPLTDASTRTDNCCGLGLLAAAQPDATLALVAAANQGPELVHAFEDEASPAVAQQLLSHLEAATYTDSAQESLRAKLLPVLRLKAAAAGPKACDWIRCDRP
jgi:hypothetical protein